MITLLRTDKAFIDSPDAGSKDCICSRCSNRILEGEVPIRIWSKDKRGRVKPTSIEWRFCEGCQRAAGKISSKDSYRDNIEDYI